MEDETSVRVAMRIRPQSAAERIDMCRVCTCVTPGHPQVVLGKDKAFTFDHVFDIETKQFMIYEQCLRGLVEGCLDGYNATVLAYGQTGSGKTYTMGTGFDIAISQEEEGIIPRAVAHLFDGITKRKQDAKQRNEPLPDFKVTVQFMELYNEELMDLFDFDNNKGRKSNVKIHEDANGNIYTMGVTMKPVNSSQDTLNCLQQGALSRTTASTNMNAQSSRSHAIFTIHVKQQRVVKICDDNDEKPSSDNINNYEYEMLTAKFNFVDLAGSERLKRTGATGDRAKEGISINCGLLALGNVISALGDATKRGSHVPYRDSKLTRLLQDSLGGNSRTLMIACVSPSDRDFMETLNTLKYANRARNIKNKVVVNQDKTSKQMAALRLEIQKLTMELLEFKQGKRVSGVDGDQVSDVCHENVILKTENDKLRVRIKALQQTIDTQSVRITELISSQVLAQVNGEEVDDGVETLIQKYLKEIEELRNKLTESEAMAMAITRHATLKSRMASPSHPEPTTSILEVAKMDVAKQRQKAQKLNHNHEGKDQPWGEQSSEESSTEEDEENEEGNEEQGDDGDDDDDDDDSDDDEVALDNGRDLSGDLADLSTEISIKEKLIDELESSQKKLQSLKTQYEEKLSLLHNKIKETETERDQVLQSVRDQDSKSEEKVRQVRGDYEKKISHLQGELKKMQAAKKEHARLLRQKAQNEQQLRTFQSELSELKKTKVRLMKQMKEEATKSKQQEAQRNKEIAQLKKESRLRQMTIKNLEMEKRQRDIVLKRKQEEVKALRRQQKPMSGKLGEQRNQTMSSTRELNGTETSSHDFNYNTSRAVTSSTSLSSSSSTSRFSGVAGRPSGLPVKSPRKKKTMEQASRSAKKKWDVIDKKVTSLILKRQTIANMESDMDRWIQDRDRLSKQLEKCQMKYNSAVSSQKEEGSVQEIKEQLEALTAHMDYVQENITDCQTSIMEMEEQGGDTAEIGEFFATCTLSEARILLEHFLTKVISLGHEASSKEASAKEVEARLNAMKQHNELQQELLQHVLQYHDSFSSIENLAAAAVGTDSEISGSELRDRLRGSLTSLNSLNSLKDDAGTLSRSSSGNTLKDSSEEGQPLPPTKPKDKARRRTGTQEEFLYPDRIKTRRPPLLDTVGDEEDGVTTPNRSLVPALPVAGEPKGARQISPELMQKLLELEKSRKTQSCESLMLPPPVPQGTQSQSQGGPVKSSRSNSLVDSSTVALPASLVRGNIKSKSARSFPGSKYGNSVVNMPRSQPTSPALQRKSLPDRPGVGVDDSAVLQKTSDDVFARLTSSLAQESDPDIGRMLPLRPPAGKPASLVCTYAATGHNSAVLSLDVTEDLMFTGSKDRTVKVWDLNTGEETLSCAGHKRDVVAVRYCHKTQRIFGASQNVIKVWDIRDGKCIKSLTPPGSSLGTFLSSMTSETQINDLKLSADGSLLYAAMGTTVRMWDLESYAMTGKLGGHAGPVMTVLLRETNKESLVFTGSRDHYVKIFELNGSNVGVQSAKSKLEPPHYDGVQSLALKGKYLFSGSRDNSIKKWNTETQQLVQHMTGAHKDWVCALDFLRPQNVLLSGCRGGMLKLWRVENGSPVCEIKAHRHPINAICTNSSCVFTASRADDYLNELFLNAAKNGDYERVQNFLARTSRNSSVNVDAKDKGGYTAVMLAAVNKHEKVVSLLLNYGADITLCNGKGQSVLDFAPDSMRPLLLGSVARQGYSSRHLLQAAWQGNSQLVKKLLASKSRSAMLDVNCRNADGLTPLLLVTRDLNLFEKIEKAVLNNGYHPAEVVKELLQHNADCGARDTEGKRPLHLAAHCKGSHAKNVVEMLIEKASSEIDVPDRFSNSPLHWATKEDNQPILLALIKGGANVNAKGYVGKTPLHIAASHGYEKSSGTLLDHGADVRITDDNGLSPVDVARGRKVQTVLRDAWAEQTKYFKSKRLFSAPVQPADQQDLTEPNTQTAVTQQVSEESTITRLNTAPLQGVEKNVKKRSSQNSLRDFSALEERKNIVPSRKISDVRMPRIPSVSTTNPGSRSSSGLVVREQSREQLLVSSARDAQVTSGALPSLSVLNIELRYVRNLRGEKPESRNKNRPYHLPLPPNYRIRHRLSSPVLTYQRKISPPATPEKDLRLRSSSTSQVPSPRVAVPSRVPPLGVNRVLTPELRSITSPDIAQPILPVAADVVDLDLLRKNGLQGAVVSAREVSPPPPSPRGSSRASNTSQGEGELESKQTQTGEGGNMTDTFTSVSRSMFWIPADDSSSDINTESSEKMKRDSSSNGTQFYIDLKNLEALASGSCSLCGESLPEEKRAGRRDSNESSPGKEFCKSCQPRRRSSEDVFWIPFTDKRKASALKTLKGESGGEATETDGRKKSNDKTKEQCKVHQMSDNQAENQTKTNSTSVMEHENKAVVLANASSKASASSKPRLHSFPSDMTGFNVSCVCDNTTGVCSCTIVKKDLLTSSFPAEQSSKTDTSSSSNHPIDIAALRTSPASVDVIKTVGEASSLVDSTLATRPGDIAASAPSSTPVFSPSTSKFKARKETDITLKSFSETDVYNPANQETTTASLSNDRRQNGDSNDKGFGEVYEPEALDEGFTENSALNPSLDASLPKQAWTTPRMEEPSAHSVRIINPFPSPVPPENKSAVHSPIGPADDTRIGNKRPTAGRKGKKGGSKPSGSSKSGKPKTKSKGPENNGKGGKKKGKGKKKDDMKMITVQQREVREELGLKTISQGGFEMPEDVPVPPTLSMNYLSTFRPFNSRTLKGKHTILSPIPESPRSKASTPRVSDTSEIVTESNEGNPEGNAVENPALGGTDEKVLDTYEGEATREEFDEVDGGIMGKLKAIGMCVPRLPFGKSNTVSGSDDECSEPLVTRSDKDAVQDQQHTLAETIDTNDNYDIQVKQVIQDEADDVMEEMLQRGLGLREGMEVKVTSSDERAESESHIITDDSLTNITSEPSSSLSQDGEQWVLSYQHSRDFSSNPVTESDIILPIEEAERQSFGSRASSEPSSSSYSEQFSDTDSSYNSCDSESPRALSPASSLNSSDTYFNSPRDSSCTDTPTPDKEMRSDNSVEIEYYERMAREKSGASRSSSNSSTIRTQSNASLGSVGNISQSSIGSFSSVMPENFVRSRLSGSARSQSSDSCQEEIVWKKGNLLGKGAFGTVWCGLTNTGEMIAVKQVELNHSNWNEAEKQYEKLQEEVSLLKSLKHNNIVKFIDTCLDGGVVNIFMEYVPGGSIASILARFGCLYESVFRRYTKQLLSGVSYLHNNNVIHRDIKGGNIMVMPSGVLKLIDFGCAKRLYMNLSMSQSNILRSMKGTPYWMAPEVIRETGHGRKSDIWSVGCTVFEMATCKPPWSDMPPMAAIFAIGSGSLAIPQLSEDFSEGARDFVNKCLTRDPDLRPTADELLEHYFLNDSQ